MSSFACKSHLLSSQAGGAFDYSDLVPVPQDDGPSPVVTIAYSAGYRNRMDLFRALVRKSELSLRALCLTEELVGENASNYTIWQYRRECLRFLGCDLRVELDFLDSNPDENPKNYQIWHHRRVIVEELGEADAGKRELAFTSEVFDADAKNYHAWAHRQWACRHFNMWDELRFIEDLIMQDVRNNSAWNHRWFVLHRGRTSVAAVVSLSGDQSGVQYALAPLPAETVLSEVAFCMVCINEARRNESPWNYLRGLVQYHGGEGISAAVLAKVKALVGEEDEGGNPFAVSMLADLLFAQGSSDGDKAMLEEALGWFTLLVTIDSIRAKAWERRRASVQALVS